MRTIMAWAINSNINRISRKECTTEVFRCPVEVLRCATIPITSSRCAVCPWSCLIPESSLVKWWAIWWTLTPIRTLIPSSSTSSTNCTNSRSSNSSSNNSNSITYLPLHSSRQLQPRLRRRLSVSLVLATAIISNNSTTTRHSNSSSRPERVSFPKSLQSASEVELTLLPTLQLLLREWPTPHSPLKVSYPRAKTCLKNSACDGQSSIIPPYPFPSFACV